MATPAIPHVPIPPPRRAMRLTIGRGTHTEHLNKPTVEWRSTAAHNLAQTSHLLGQANAMRIDTNKTSLRVKRDVEEQLSNVNKQLEVRIRQMETCRARLAAMKAALEKGNSDLQFSMDKAIDMKTRLHRPLDKCTARAELRNKRPGAENISDAVSAALQAQSETLTRELQNLETILLTADATKTAILKQLVAIKADTENKEASIAVDRECLEYTGRDEDDVAVSRVKVVPQIMIPGVTAKASVDPHSWKHVTEYNQSQTDRLLATTKEVIKKLHAAVANARLAHQEKNVSTTKALEEKARATLQQEKRLASQLNRIDDEMQVLQQQTQDVRAAIQSHVEPTKQTVKRLEARRARPPLENVRDEVEKQLAIELQLLQNGVHELNKKDVTLEAEIRALRTAHYKLRQQQLAKQCSLALDEQCLELDRHQRYNASTRAGTTVGTRTPSIASTPQNATPKASTPRLSEAMSATPCQSERGGTPRLPPVHQYTPSTAR